MTRQIIIRRPRQQHGLWRAHKSEWQCWVNIWRRCYDPRLKSFKNYGGRGIQLCARWHSFTNFLADMGSKPSGQKLTIERKNNDGNYEPGNCKWAPYRENLSNRRNTLWFNYQGQNLTLIKIAQLAGMKRATLYGRIHRGKTLEQALLPVKYERRA